MYYVRSRTNTNEKWKRQTLTVEGIENLIERHLNENQQLRMVIKKQKEESK